MHYNIKIKSSATDSENANVNKIAARSFQHFGSFYLHIGVAQFQAVSLVKLGGVFQDFHDRQQVAAVLCPFVG